MPGNKTLSFHIAYYTPEQRTEVPSKRYYTVEEDVPGTSVSRALGKFWRIMADEYGYGKKDLLVVGCMPVDLPNGREGVEEDVDDEEDTAEEELGEDESDEYEEEDGDDEDDEEDED